MKKTLGVFGFLVALAATPTASADEQGDKGLLWSLQINAPGSDNHSRFHGAIEVKAWKKGKKKSPTFKKYVWGGSNCPNRNLEDEQIQVLALAMANRMKVHPAYVPGQLPNTRCLVSFKLFRSWGGGGEGGGGGGNQPDDDD